MPFNNKVDITIPIELNNFNDDCMICLDTINLGKQYLNYDTVILNCNHVYHYQCLLNWVIDSKQVYYRNIKCPLCNQNVPIKIKYHNSLKKKHTHAIVDELILKTKHNIIDNYNENKLNMNNN